MQTLTQILTLTVQFLGNQHRQMKLCIDTFLPYWQQCIKMLTMVALRMYQCMMMLSLRSIFFRDGGEPDNRQFSNLNFYKCYKLVEWTNNSHWQQKLTGISFHWTNMPGLYFYSPVSKLLKMLLPQHLQIILK